MTAKKLSREAIAKIEIGKTEISPSLAKVISLFFLVVIFIVPVSQLILDTTSGKNTLPALASFKKNEERNVFENINTNNKVVLENISEIETELEENSFLRKLFLPHLQSFFLYVLHQGNEKVVTGKDGNLFYRPGVDYLLGQPFLDDAQLQRRFDGHEIWEKPVQPDPLQAILDFKEELAKREIELLLLPIPIKPAIEPETLATRNTETSLTNRSWKEFTKQLEEEGIAFFDARPILQNYVKEHGQAYLKTDTHWLPGAMQAVAEAVALSIKQRYPQLEASTSFVLQEQAVEGAGDIVRMLTLPSGVDPFGKQKVSPQQVLTEDNEFWQPSGDSELLLLGDSFTNIYSTPGLGWGVGSGFAEHLSYYLKINLDLIAQNDSGAFATREALAKELGRGRDRLAGKRLVIWQFAERELGLGNWKMLDLTLAEPRDSGFFTAEYGENLVVRGTVQAISRSPRPGSVPYRDNIVTLHLVDLETAGQAMELDQALVYGFGMQDNTLTNLAGLRAGDQIEISLSSWEEVEAEYGSFRRSPLDDEMIELELPNWGHLNEDEN